MKRIIIYVSDHNYGHATRMIALVRLLRRKGSFDIVIKNSQAFGLIAKSIPRIPIEDLVTDVGPVINNQTNIIDLNLTYKKFSNWIKGEQQWLNREALAFKKNPADLIISDISPMALRLAEKVRCPSLTIGNFSWIDILKKLPYHPMQTEILAWLKESFSFCVNAIELPLSMNMEGFRNTIRSSLLYRERTADKKNTFNSLQLSSSITLISFGGQPPPKFRVINPNKNMQVFLITPYDINAGDIRVVLRPTESQNFIAAADFVIAKSGYSTIAECMAFRCPMYIVPRAGYPEDQILCEGALKFGIGKILDLNENNFCISIPTIDEIQDLKARINERLICSLSNLPRPEDIVTELI